jgi:DNA-binding ferritin-like protein
MFAPNAVLAVAGHVLHEPTGGRSMHPNTGLSNEQREGVVALLNTLLSDEYLLYTKTRNYHWNVVGPQFNDLHKFF